MAAAAGLKAARRRRACGRETSTSKDHRSTSGVQENAGNSAVSMSAATPWPRRNLYRLCRTCDQGGLIRTQQKAAGCSTPDCLPEFTFCNGMQFKSFVQTLWLLPVWPTGVRGPTLFQVNLACFDWLDGNHLQSKRRQYEISGRKGLCKVGKVRLNPERPQADGLVKHCAAPNLSRSDFS